MPDLAYTRSEELALRLGYREVEDPDAFNGRYFIKDGLIWIHNITALKARLRITDDNELRQDYDVDAYYEHNSWR